jgi:GNAT superfamily N-acetyltransferase
MIRRAETRADLEAHAGCWEAVWPEDAVSVDFVMERLAREPERLYLNLVEGRQVVGTGFVGRSSRPGFRPVAVTVLPGRRGRGLGGALLDACLEHARSLGGATALGTVREDEPGAVSFVLNRGFEVMDRVVSLALDLDPGTAAEAQAPDGINIVQLEPTRHEEAYAVFCEGVADIPTEEPLQAPSFGDWATEVERNLLTLLALDGDRVVGFANLEVRNTPLGVVGNGLTTVVRSHRGRGIAQALKRAEIDWAAAQGFRRITTATHSSNDAMRRVNEKLGYRPLPALLDVVHSL